MRMRLTIEASDWNEAVRLRTVFTDVGWKVFRALKRVGIFHRRWKTVLWKEE